MQTKTKSIFKIVFAVFMIMILIFPNINALANSNFGGDGSKENPYKISSVEDFKTLITVINGEHLIPGTTKKYYDESLYYELSSDIVLSGNITPIKNFNGRFNGNGFAIKNISIYISEDQSAYNKGAREKAALFTTLGSTAVVENLIIENATITNYNYYYASVLAYQNSGTIQNVTVKGNISVTASSPWSGWNNGEASGLVSINSGIIDKLSFMPKGTIKVGGSPSKLGGIAISNNGSIINSTIDLRGIEITSTGDGNIPIGGIAAVAGNTSIIKNNNIVIGKIQHTSWDGIPNIGGIVGTASGGRIARNEIILNDDISATSEYKGTIAGVLGSGSGEIRDNNITFKTQLKNYTYTPVTGGIAGTFSGNITNNNLTLNNVYAVDSYNSDSAVSFGGLVGNLSSNNSTINNNVVRLLGTLTVTKYTRVSGFIGSGDGRVSNAYLYSSQPLLVIRTQNAYLCGKLDSGHSDAKLAEIIGSVSSPHPGDVAIAKNDKVITILEKWVKQNSTFENQYARWGIVLNGADVFPFLSFENPDMVLTVDGNSYDGSKDSKKPMSFLFNNDIAISWEVYDWSEIDVIKNGEKIVVDYVGGLFALSCDVDAEATYVITGTTDQGNNVYFEFYIDKVFPNFNEGKLKRNKDFLKTKYYEYNNKYFSSYKEAYGEYKVVAIREKVREKNLTDVNLFAEKLAAGEVVKTGSYYRYQLKGTDYECYFSYDNLLNRIETDFNNEVKESYLNHGSNLIESRLTDKMYDSKGITLGKSVYLIKDIKFAKTDSISIEISKFEENEFKAIAFEKSLIAQLENPRGVYEIRETDIAGNVSSYFIYFDDVLNDVEIKIKMYGADEVEKRFSTSELNGGIFYFENFEFVNVNDVDRQSLIEVTKKGSSVRYFNVGVDAMPNLAEKGEYLVKLYDRSGNVTKFTVFVGTETPKVDFYIKSGNLNIDIENVMLRKYNSLEIKRNSVILARDDGGTDINAEMLSYVFSEGGYYTVTIIDGFNRTLIYEYLFEKNLPKFIEVVGIKSDVAVGDVELKFDKLKYKIEVILNGKEFVASQSEVGSITTISILNIAANNGSFVVYLKDINNENFYSTLKFKILIMENIPTLVGVSNGGQTGGEVLLTWESDEITATYTRDGIFLGKYEKGDKLKANGYYTITAKDGVGKEFKFNFTIKENLDYRILVGGKYVNRIEITNQSVQFETAFPLDNIIVISDKWSKKVEYKWGQIISEEGIYSVKVISLTSTSNFKFVIDKTPPIGKLKGVSESGQTNGKVSLDWSEDDLTARVFEDGKLVGNYLKSKDIDENGQFEVQLIDRAGNITSFKFRIKRTVDITMNVIDGGISNVPVKLSSQESELELLVEKDGEQITQKISKAFNENGHYKFKVYDKFDNVVEREFYVLTTPIKNIEYSLPKGYKFIEFYKDSVSVPKKDYIELGNGDDGDYEFYYENTTSNQKFSFKAVIDTVAPIVRLVGVENGGSTDNVVKVESDEDVELIVKRNGENMSYKLGTEISSDGDFEITARDLAGNEAILNFNRVWKINTAGKVAVGGGGATVLGTAFELLRRRKIKFK